MKYIYEIINNMLSKSKDIAPYMDINPGSHVMGLTEDLALNLADLRQELRILANKYDIKQEDMLGMLSALDRTEYVPARFVKRCLGDNK